MTAPVDIRVLRALPTSTRAGRWHTPVALAVELRVAPDDARSVLVGRRRCGFSEDDRAFPQAVGRAVNGDWLIEHNDQPEQSK
jgi:hypothetical protein